MTEIERASVILRWDGKLSIMKTLLPVNEWSYPEIHPGKDEYEVGLEHDECHGGHDVGGLDRSAVAASIHDVRAEEGRGQSCHREDPTDSMATKHPGCYVWRSLPEAFWMRGELQESDELEGEVGDGAQAEDDGAHPHWQAAVTLKCCWVSISEII